MQKIIPHLWFDKEAEEAANFYVSIFSERGRDSKILHIARYAEAAVPVSGKPAGSVMTVEFMLDGQKFVALNGGPIFTFNESISFIVPCDSQEEIDYFWEKLSAVPGSEQCGWLKDKYGVSWQISSSLLNEMMNKGTPEQVDRVTQAFLLMKKFDIAKLKQVYERK